MRKIISYSLWGDSKLYCQGAIDNLDCARKHYPDWVVRFYIAEDCPALPVLQKLDCEIEVMPPTRGIDRTTDPKEWHNDPNNYAMMWRFYAIDEADADYVIFRDVDSRLGGREAAAVDAWIESGLYVHRMHECAEHWNAVIMGGMWGIKGGKVFPSLTVRESVDIFVREEFPTLRQAQIFIDLYYIQRKIWPKVRLSCLGHGYGHAIPLLYPGDPVGSVVHEEWRSEKYVCTCN